MLLQYSTLTPVKSNLASQIYYNLVSLDKSIQYLIIDLVDNHTLAVTHKIRKNSSFFVYSIINKNEATAHII